MAAKTDFKRFEVVDRASKLRIVSLGFDVVLYTDRNFTDIAPSVLHAYDRFLELCPPERLKWYANENMNKHKPCAKRELELPRVWLRKGGPRRETLKIDLHDGETYAHTPEFLFWMYGEEHRKRDPSDSANMVRLGFPAEWGRDRPGELLELAKDLCNHFPFQSGHSGYVFQTTRYRINSSETAAWKLGRRYPGPDIRNEVGDMVAVRSDGIKGVNWLTIVCDVFLKRIGGPEKLKKVAGKDVEWIRVEGGWILKAGPAPAIGDLNQGDTLPAYRAVYRALEPLQRPTMERYGSFSMLEEDSTERTDAWMRRFAGE
jgi:hypothetical protein